MQLFSKGVLGFPLALATVFALAACGGPEPTQERAQIGGKKILSSEKGTLKNDDGADVEVLRLTYEEDASQKDAPAELNLTSGSGYRSIPGLVAWFFFETNDARHATTGIQYQCVNDSISRGTASLDPGSLSPAALRRDMIERCRKVLARQH